MASKCRSLLLFSNGKFDRFDFYHLNSVASVLSLKFRLLQFLSPKFRSFGFTSPKFRSFRFLSPKFRSLRFCYWNCVRFGFHDRQNFGRFGIYDRTFGRLGFYWSPKLRSHRGFVTGISMASVITTDIARNFGHDRSALFGKWDRNYVLAQWSYISRSRVIYHGKHDPDLYKWTTI